MERGGMVGASHGTGACPNYIMAAALIVLFSPVPCGPCTQPENPAPSPVKSEGSAAWDLLEDLDPSPAKLEDHGASGTRSPDPNSPTELDDRECDVGCGVM